MKCATHPEVETNLRCGKCGRPICPKCLVQTLVGTRCSDCARLKRLPTFEVYVRQYVIASGVGLGVAAAAGIAWAFIYNLVSYLLLYLLLAAAVGYAIGELISLSVNRKRGPILQAIAGCSMILSFAIGYPFLDSFNLYLLFGLALGLAIAIVRLR